MGEPRGEHLLTVLVADDQPVPRWGTIQLLTGAGLDVTGEIDDLERLGETVDALCPEVVVLEPAGADRGRALAALVSFTASHPDVRVLAFTCDVSPPAVEAALEAGCLGVVPKTASAAALVDGVRTVAAGDRHLHQRALGAMLLRRQAAEVLRAIRPLSVRELTVLELIAEGRSNGDIAGELGVSDATIKTHVAHLLRKLQATDRAHAVSRALRLGLIR